METPPITQPTPKTDSQADIQFRKEQREAANKLKKMMEDLYK